MGNTKATLQFFWKYTKHYPWQVFVACMVLVQIICNVIIIPLLIGFGIAKISRPSSVGLSFGSILGLIAINALLGVFFNRIATKALNKFEIAATKDIHLAMAEHILHESYEFHSKSFSGALISQASRLAGAYVTFIDTVFQSAIRFVIIVFASSITLLFYDVRLAGIMLTCTLLGVLTTSYLVRKRYPLQKAAIAKISEQTAYLADMITNAVTVKTFAAETQELKAYEKINHDVAKKMWASWDKQINANNMTLFMVAVMNISILAYGIYAIQHGFLTTGVFIAAQLYAVRLSGSFWDASSLIRTFERVFADAQEMVTILNTPVALTNTPDALDLHVSEGELAFTNVTFHYNDTKKTDSVLDNFSLTLKPGEKIGLVGRSGGGKSTITKLVLRFMDIQQGRIEIDGQDISRVTQESLRKSIAYVPQEPLLFHRTIAENISYGNANATTSEVEKAAKLAQAHDFIMSLPKQYATEVGERGVKLSGGQRQRIAIARALLKDAPILVLDEATSALDSESEVLIQEALWKLMENRTALVIAHRLSTVQKMDQIIVVDDGKIIEQGTHTELIKKSGVYAELWKHQSGGFLED